MRCRAAVAAALAACGGAAPHQTPEVGAGNVAETTARVACDEPMIWRQVPLVSSAGWVWARGDDLPTTTRITVGEDPEVRLDATVAHWRFGGTVDATDSGLSPMAPTWISSNIALLPGARPTIRRAEVGAVELGLPSGLTDWDFETDPSAMVPCAGLTARSPAPRDALAALQLEPIERNFGLPAGTAWLAEFDGAPFVTVRGDVEVHVLGYRGDWAQVAAEPTGGVVFRGWVHRDGLAPIIGMASASTGATGSIPRPRCTIDEETVLYARRGDEEVEVGALLPGAAFLFVAKEDDGAIQIDSAGGIQISGLQGVEWRIRTSAEPVCAR